MARTGRPKAELVLSEAEREALERWARRPSSAQALAQRSRMVLACAEGESNQAVARRERVTPQMVGKWRKRFVERRLDGLVDEEDGGGDGAQPGRDLQDLAHVRAPAAPRRALEALQRPAVRGEGPRH